MPAHDHQKNLPLPTTGIVPLEFFLERSRDENRTLATLPTLLSLIVFAGAEILCVASLAIPAVAAIEGERHDSSYDKLPDLTRQFLRILVTC